MDSTELLLPDNVLLDVLAYLPARQLLSCRMVSRRLRDLCMHRALWKNAQVCGRGLMRAALSLAPCLFHLSTAEVPLEVVASYVAGTKCVVSALSLEVTNQADALFASLIVQKLAAVGGLEMLELEVSHTFSPELTLTPLVQVVYDIGGLRKLDIGNNSNVVLPAAWCDREVRPSITDLVYLSSCADPFLELLLRTHAGTLRKVSLYLTEGTPVPSLARIPGLQSLICHPHEDLPQLLEIPHLDTLELMESPVDEPFNPGALDLLRRASHLRTVTFSFTFLNPHAPLLALGGSPSARLLQSLELLRVLWLDLDLLAATLPQFPCLRTLSLDVFPSYGFFRAVSPTSAPSLCTLTVCPSSKLCPHAWLHGPAVQDLLQRNRCLHLSLCVVPGGSTITIPENCHSTSPSS